MSLFLKKKKWSIPLTTQTVQLNLN